MREDHAISPSLLSLLGNDSPFNGTQTRWLQVLDSACEKILGPEKYCFKRQKNRVTFYPNGSSTKFITFYFDYSLGRLELPEDSKAIGVSKAEKMLDELGLLEVFEVSEHPTLVKNYFIKPLSAGIDELLQSDAFIALVEHWVQASYKAKFGHRA